MAPTKTTVIDEVDAWQVASAASLVVGAAEDVSGSYDTLLQIELAYGNAVAHDGCEVIIEVSYADDNWVELYRFPGTVETAGETETNEDPTPAGATRVILLDATTDDFNVPGRKWFIKDGTIGNAESVRTDWEAGNEVGICHDTLREHATGVKVYDRVDEWNVPIPFPVSYLRTLVNNLDGNCDSAFTTRISKVTALT